jgi:uncharacterized RDD family membrane protein YckC
LPAQRAAISQKYLSALLLGIGFIMAAFTAQKRALHDMMAETIVVNR